MNHHEEHQASIIFLAIRDSADPTDIRIINVAVGIAYYKLTIQRLSGEDSITSFKAGDITVSKSATAALEIAGSLRDERLRAALPLLKDEEFVFKQVGI